VQQENTNGTRSVASSEEEQETRAAAYEEHIRTALSTNTFKKFSPPSFDHPFPLLCAAPTHFLTKCTPCVGKKSGAKEDSHFFFRLIGTVQKEIMIVHVHSVTLCINLTFCDVFYA
jgi:hypothetical protein